MSIRIAKFLLVWDLQDWRHPAEDYPCVQGEASESRQVLPMCFSVDFRSPAESFLFDFLGGVNMRRVSYGWAWEEARAMPFVNFGGRCQVVFQPEVIILAD